MDKVKTTLHTDGKGLWSKTAKAVKVIGLEVIDYSEDDEDAEEVYGELQVYFDTKTWAIHVDGLIYTDDLFEKQLIEFLIKLGYNGSDVTYSEQGMQDENYVSFDIGEEFINSYKAKQ